MNAGAELKTTNRIIRVFWPSERDARDFRVYSDVGQWVGKNEKVLNKTPLEKCCKLIAEQFPQLTEVEVRDYTGRIYRT
jgi:hypothetical protein